MLLPRSRYGIDVIRIALIDQVSMQVSQLIDSIGPADRFVIVLA
jgi:hypothetical protein